LYHQGGLSHITLPQKKSLHNYEFKDLYLRDITTRQLDFVSPFTLTSTSDRRIKIHALVLYFDTFFTPSGSPIPAETQVDIIKSEDAITAEVWPVGGKPNPLRRRSMNYKLAQTEMKEKVTSFSTGPESIPTHWKQTVFFLREPIVAEEGTRVFSWCHSTRLYSHFFGNI
jgi:type I protein arginine methyltransferase